tara:strand:+ start:9129 stop:9491 length:363 start_codon:yes stop_codon:yes gene_type:complete
MKNNLLLDDSLFNGVINGKVTNTIRNGHRDISTGQDLVTASHGTRSPLCLDIHTVKTTTFKEITLEDLQHQGIKVTPQTFAVELSKFLEDMQQFYPHITTDAEVTIIQFKYLSGGQPLTP